MPYPEDKVTFYEDYPQRLKAKAVDVKRSDTSQALIGHKVVVNEDGTRSFIPRNLEAK